MAQDDIIIGAANAGNGDNLFTAFTKVQNNFTELYGEPSISLVGNTLTLTRPDDTTSTVDLSSYLDEDARAISTGTLDGSTGIVTFTRDDASTFTLDLSALLDDTNTVTSVNSQTGAVVLDSDDVAEGLTNLYDKVVSLSNGSNITITGTYPNFTISAANLVTDSSDQALASATSLTLTNDILTLTKGDGTTDTVDLSIYEDITAINTPSDDMVLTYDSISGGYEWRYDYTTTPDNSTIQYNGFNQLEIVDNVDLPGNEKVGIPSGTTAQRPSVPAAGMLRYNTTTGEFEGYTTSWGAIGGGDLSNIYVDTFTGDGSTTGFTASQTISVENNTQIYIDGVYQSKSNYSTSGTTVTFSVPPPNGSAIEMIHVKAIALTTIAADSVDYEKIDNEFKTSSSLIAGASVDVDFDAAQVFTLTPNQNTTLNITNPKVGITKAVILTGAGGSYTLGFTVGGASGTFNKIAGDYDDTSSTKNFIQIICVSATEFWYSISQIA